MGLFDLFKKKEKKPTIKITTTIQHTQSKPQSAQDKQFDKELKALQKADADFKIDKDLDKVIKVYESVLNGCTWNAFNYQKKLASYYVKAEKYDDAWRVLNQAQHDAVKRGHGKACTGQVRMEQFKVLKAEKKYKDAMDILCRAYVVNNAEFGSWNRDSFIKTAKTTAKGLGLSDERLNEIADQIDRAVKRKDTSETNIRQAIAPLLKK